MIPELKKIWARDKSKNKLRARQDFTFVYFYADVESPFADKGRVERLDRALNSSKTTSDYVNDADLQSAVKFYVDCSQGVEYQLIDNAITALSNAGKTWVIKTEAGGKGLTTSDLAAINKLNETLSKLRTARNDLREQAKVEKAKTGQGGSEITDFEMPGSWK